MIAQVRSKDMRSFHAVRMSISSMLREPSSITISSILSSQAITVASKNMEIILNFSQTKKLNIFNLKSKKENTLEVFSDRVMRQESEN